MPSAVAPVSGWDHLAQLYGPSQPSTPCSALEEQVPAKIPKNEFSQKTQTGIYLVEISLKVPYLTIYAFLSFFSYEFNVAEHFWK